MDCNRVFVALTAGPFPSGRADDAVIERHLLACAGCRRIAEALRPHDEQLHESLPTMERASLPRYRGVHRHATAMAAVLQGGGAAKRPPSAPGGQSSQAGWRRELSVRAPEAQVASFCLAPRRRTATPYEAFSMLATLALAAAAFLGLGVLAL